MKVDSATENLVIQKTDQIKTKNLEKLRLPPITPAVVPVHVYTCCSTQCQKWMNLCLSLLWVLDVLFSVHDIKLWSQLFDKK